MEKFLAWLGSLPEGVTEAQKTEIRDLYKEKTVEAGKAKTDLESYKAGDLSYKALVAKLKAAGIDPEKFDEVAKKLGVTKSLEEEIEIFKVADQQKTTKLAEAEKKIQRMTAEGVLGKKLDLAIAEYKTAEGKPVKIIDDFLDKEGLFKQNIDLTSDVLVSDAIKKVLDAAVVKQGEFFKKAGINPDAVGVHIVKATDGGTSTQTLDVNATRQILKTGGGSVDSVARAFELAAQAEKAAA